MINDEEYLRKSYLFFNGYPYNYHEYIIGKKAQIYDILSDYFDKKGDTEKATHYINLIKEDVKENIYFDEKFYYKKAERLKKAKKIQDALKIYGYLYFIYDKEDARDSIKVLCKDDFENKLKKIEEIVKKEFALAPDFEGITASGEKFRLSENKGKIIVFNFWSINCNPCVKEIPELNEIVEEFKNNNDVIFIAVTYDKKEDIEKFSEGVEFKYKIVITDSDIFKKYRVFAIPAHMIINSKGCIVFRQNGYTEDLKEKILNKINRLIVKR